MSAEPAFGAVKDVTDASFQADVVDASFKTPVVVDFWAPWCGPCRTLSPLLERLATEANGAWTLAKIDVDQNPGLSNRYGIQGIPAVKGFRDGQIINQFTGAQPEPMVRHFIERLSPSVSDVSASKAARLVADGDLTGAEAAYRVALDAQPSHARATLGLGILFAQMGRADEALALLTTLGPHGKEGQEAAPVVARLRLMAALGTMPPLDDARAAIARDPRDLAANLTLGQAAAAQGDYAEALAHLLAVVERDKTYAGGKAREHMLTVFNVLGDDDALTKEYRRRLASALHA